MPHHPDQYRRIARKTWVRHHGPIPPGHHIHHIDGDDTNFDIENLECLTWLAHRHKHMDGPPRIVTCTHCAQVFEDVWAGHAIFCSNACKAAARRASGVDDVDRECVRCGVVFTVNRYKPQQYCSLECSDPGSYERTVRAVECVECGLDFEAKTPRALYCSVRCRKRHDRRRAGKTVGTRPRKELEHR